jgi:hypothetical protein
VGIGDEVARRRAEEASAREAAKQAAERVAERQAAATRQREADMEAKELALRSLGRRFMLWTGQAGIAPTAVTNKRKTTFFGGSRQVPKDMGWLLDPGQVEIPDKEGNRGWLQEGRARIAVLTNGDIRSVSVVMYLDNPHPPMLPTCGVAKIEALIVDFVVKSGSSVPWPD